MTGADRIFVRGLRVFGHHGVTEEEREAGQDFVIELECELDLGPAGRSDDLADTVDYEALANRAAAIAGSRRFRLLEALAAAVADAALEHPAITRVRVKVEKPDPPVSVLLDSLGVEITRSR